LFLVEGIHPVGEAIEAGWKVDAILYAPESLTSDFGRELLTRVPAALQPVTPQVMESLADKDNPQGILAIVHQGPSSLEQVQLGRLGVALVTPQDPGNVGTILRTLEAVGADALFLLDGGADPYHPTCVRASMGALFWKPVVQATFAAFQEWRLREGCQLIGTSAHADVDYRDLTPGPPFILLFGSEQKGLSPGQIQACDAAVSLPMRGRASSLNLAVAAGVLLYQFAAPR
jgi:TrmH family RNA methyltransferase